MTPPLRQPPCETAAARLAPETPARRRAHQHWIHLRLCVSRGHVGCCDASAHHHARRHVRATGQPIVQSPSGGESWRRCHLDETIV